jgi:Na+/melibiose symporter-like transporter
MNTLKLKVLLILSNRSLWRSVSQALLIWSATSFTGCTLVYAIETVNPPLDVWEAYILTLIFSSPAVIAAVLVTYYLHRFSSRAKRIAFSIGSILFVSAGIIGVVASIFKIEYSIVADTLLPFIPSALLWFFLFTRKQLLTEYTISY